MANDENYEHVAFGVDGTGAASPFETDDITGDLKIILTGDATVPGKQSVQIDDNYFTTIVVDDGGEPVSLACNSNGAIYVNTDNLNVV
jgi:hypothetical protein